VLFRSTPPLPNLAQFLFPLWVGLLSVVVLLRRHSAASAAPIAAPGSE